MLYLECNTLGDFASAHKEFGKHCVIGYFSEMGEMNSKGLPTVDHGVVVSSAAIDVVIFYSEIIPLNDKIDVDRSEIMSELIETATVLSKQLEALGILCGSGRWLGETPEALKQ